MKKYFPHLTAVLFLFLFSCSDSNDIEDVVDIVDPQPEPEVPVNPNADINEYIWDAMNLAYLWQGDVPDLADDRFPTDADKQEYLQNTPEPEPFFNSLIYDPENVDFFSFFLNDYREFENQSQGTSLSNGLDFGLARYGAADGVFGYVRMVLPGSDADGKNIKRGDVFTEVDGRELTLGNYRSLLFGENTTYTLAISEIINNTITPTGESVELTKTDYTEPSVNNISVIEEGGKRIGYLHYTQFTSQESELNAAFLELKNEGITDLVLDLRYNPGGYATVSTSLASMITGQFTGEVIKKETWNAKYQNYWESNDPDRLEELFRERTSGYFSDENLNSLNLSSIHIIGLSGTASASESLISGLQPYIDVTLVGELTYGKYTGSATFYDNPPSFGREGANPDHTYAIQPIIYKFSNRDGGSPQGGIQPDIEISEDIGNMGVIGSRNEPLLKAAIDDIVGISAKTYATKGFDYEKITDYRLEKKFATSFIDTKPGLGEVMKKMKEKN